MKITFFFIQVLCIASITATVAQDTIFKKNNDLIIGKVTEISPTEIKYKMLNNLDGPNIIIYASDIYKIKYLNGTETIIKPDIYSQNQEPMVIDKVQSVKINVFSPLNYSITLGYEKKINVGKNLEVKIGYVGLGYSVTDQEKARGGFIKAGIKFLFGQDYYVKGMKYTHPLKGRYLKPELSYSYLVYRNEEFTVRVTNYNFSSHTVQSNVIVSGSSLQLIYGRQFILSNKVTLDYFVGIGYGFFDKINFSNIEVNNNEINYRKYTINCFGFGVYSTAFPFAYSAGLNFGYIF